ncbi:MAG TPA: epoxyqueuosine reductase QueH [Candidatus Borkfalkia excrementavium]|uniref:Epoxyqueuosine reductase QueH n=1 Tax=Candidatus Borkfalkia excrementavium TaxID=2838505 RepID=A0A9D1Z8G1_9FIRM|nr:epoxyqueuosine reductase QueH [Candidatus Borkfalkia excrementavium]
MNRIDYNKIMRETLQQVPAGARLLLHSCCGPCSSRCLETLKDVFRVTVYYYNPNITEEEEYLHRKGEQIRLLKETGWADFLDCDYQSGDFFRAVRGLEGEPEGGARCKICYQLRLDRTAQAAKENGYDWFCTTLSVSPHKNAGWINELGARAQQKYGVRWLYSDFKKENGYLRSVELAKTYGLYRQNYCGCVFSDWRKNKIEE